MSGGVRNIPTTKQNIIMKGRFSISALLLVMPLVISSIVAMGISNVRPNAKKSLITVLRY